MSLSPYSSEELHAALPPGGREELARILARARADVEHMMYVMGSGTPSTLKRAKALELALDGKGTPAIAASVGLSEERVGQVLRNVLASGFSALYPGFAEQVPLPDGQNLWTTIGPLIRSLPPDRGVRTACWNPAIVLDYLVHNGTLHDGSVGQITVIIQGNLNTDSTPPTFEYVDTAHQQAKPPAVGVSALFVLMGIGIIALGVFEASSSLLSALALGGFGVLWTGIVGLTLVKQLQERALLRRVVAAKKARTGPAPTEPLPPPPAKTAALRAVPLPPPPFTIGHALSLPDVRWQTDAITDTANAFGEPPLPVLYLWVFAAQADQRGFETEGWPQLGPVHLLLNATALTINKLARADKLLTGDNAALEAEVAAYEDRAGSYPRPNLFYTIEGSSKSVYRGYPIHTLICTDGVWQSAFRLLAARSRIAIVNLSGFNPSHPGLEFEILHLLAGGPPERFVFLYERTTDADAVVASVLGLWSRLDSPPAATPTLHFFRIPESQDVGYALQFNRKMTFGLGWLGKIHLDREGPYTPIAGRIVAFLEQREGRSAAPVS